MDFIPWVEIYDVLWWNVSIWAVIRLELLSIVASIDKFSYFFFELWEPKMLADSTIESVDTTMAQDTM